jgi:hypothetical protein
MSVSIQSLFTPDEFALELVWLKARDTLLGINYVKQDVKRALELAAASEHPQCQWLTGVFAGKSVKTSGKARRGFLDDQKKSPASLCFAALLSDAWDEALVRQSADLGYSLAQARMADRMSGEERFQFANLLHLNKSVCAFVGSGIVIRSAMDVRRIWTRPENAISLLLNSATLCR